MRYFCAIVLLILPFIGNSQEKKKEALTGTVIAASGFVVGDITSSTLEKFDTRWTQLPGYGYTFGAGFQLNASNNWAIEADFGYESNTYVYDRADLRIQAGYFIPYIDFKATKFFSKKDTRPKFWYVKCGAAYHFLSGKSLTNDETQFQYELQLADQGVITFLPEIGRHRKLGGNSSLQVGLLVQYSPKTILTTTLHAKNELQNAIGSASGTYVGLTFKYFYGFAALGGGRSGGKSKNDPKIRIEI